MGWSFRKSTSFGPFRFTFSKSGISTSFGVKGARVSFSKRGTFVNLGANGIYYRQRIDTPRKATRNHFVPPADVQPSNRVDHSIGTQDVERVTDVDSKRFIEQLEKAANRRPLFTLLGVVPSIAIYVYALSFAGDVVDEHFQYEDVFTVTSEVVHIQTAPSVSSQSLQTAKEFDSFVVAAPDSNGWKRVFLDGSSGPAGFVRNDLGKVNCIERVPIRTTRLQQYPSLAVGYIFLTLLLIVWCVYLKMLDRKRRTVEIVYALDGEIANLHNKFLEYFREFASSGKVWQKLHATGVDNVKYHAGASQLISRMPVGGVFFNLPPLKFLKTNVSVPSIHLKGTELYFFPERLIVKRGKSFGAIFYKNMTISPGTVNFIESDDLAADSTVVDHTWQYLNKQGGPDRRFSGNRRLPICLYSEYTFESDSGLQEVITTSRQGAMDNFSAFVKVIGDFQRKLDATVNH
ncbi:MAG TPA: DUF4236 domain-containing protein [Chryseolinea sp.]|nr:DUF4236 domain-containing protein [Chryseolinea sp.]